METDTYPKLTLSKYCSESCRQTLSFMASDKERPQLPPVSDHTQCASATWPCSSEQEPQVRPSATVCCVPHFLSAEFHASPCFSPSPKWRTPLHALIYLSVLVLPEILWSTTVARVTRADPTRGWLQIVGNKDTWLSGDALHSKPRLRQLRSL